MATLIIGLVVFLGLHSTRIFANDARAKAIARLGEGPWKGIYSLLSLIGLALIIWGFAQARWNAAVLWAPPVFVRHIAIALMLVSLILLGGYVFKKSHIAVAVHHPMVWSVAVWSAAHLFANGSAASRRYSMKSCAAGLKARFFSVMMFVVPWAVASSTGKTLNWESVAPKWSADS